MPAPAPPVDERAAAHMRALGARLRTHRKALRVSATAAAEAAGISRMTLHRIENGEPSVTLGAYFAVAHALALDIVAVDPHAKRQGSAGTLPKRIRLADHPELQRLAWQRAHVDKATVTPEEALALYERNWRHVDQAMLSPRERELIDTLVEVIGEGRLLV